MADLITLPQVDDPALNRHLDEILAEMRDAGISPTPLNLLAFALDAGLTEQQATALVGLLEQRQKGGAV